MENYLSHTTPSIRRFLLLIKTKGPLSTSKMAQELGMTTEGARLHLQKLADEGLVVATAETKGVGRPSQVWSLTEAGNNYFPNAHSDLTVQLIENIQNAVGDEALNQIIDARQQVIYRQYAERLNAIESLEQKIDQLAEMRSRDGYLAEWKKETEGEYLFIENHCPIGAAALKCNHFCLSELNMFQTLFGPQISIIRISYMLNGERRCAYRIRKKEAGTLPSEKK